MSRSGRLSVSALVRCEDTLPQLKRTARRSVPATLGTRNLQWFGTSLEQRRLLIGLCCVMLLTFRFAATHNASSFESPGSFGDDRPLTGNSVSVAANDDPVVSGVLFIREWGIGIQSSVLPIVAIRVQDRQPCFSFRIEAQRRNSRKSSRFLLLAKFGIDGKQLSNQWFVRRSRRNGCG